MASSKVKTVKKARKQQKQQKKRPAQKPSSASELSDKEVCVDMEFFNMSEVDFHSVKQFLSVSFGTSGHGINLSEFAACVTEECADHVGTAAKTEGEGSDPVAIVTYLPFRYASGRDFCKHLLDFLATKCEGRLEGVDVNRCALVLNERFINMPAGIAGPMLENLVGDWERAIREDGLFRVDHVFLLTPCYRLIKSELDAELGLEGEADGSERAGENNFYYQEAEYLGQFAEWQVLFQTATPHTTTDSRRAFTEHGVDAFRELFCLKWPKFIEFVKKVGAEFVD
jgi:hypothetical protein